MEQPPCQAIGKKILEISRNLNRRCANMCAGSTKPVTHEGRLVFVEERQLELQTRRSFRK